MRSRSVISMPAVSLVGLGVGLVAGAAVGLLATPMRGAEIRRTLRSRADDAVERGMTLIEEGRRAFRTRGAADASATSVATASTPSSRALNAPSSSPVSRGSLSATLGEIAQLHSGDELSSLGGRS
jgi:gas vesicle protein